MKYASVTATLALVVALGGTSYAASQLPKNAVGTKQLKKDAVVGKKVKDDSLTGADLVEASLGQVPSAAKAASADSVGGKSLRGLQQWVVVSDGGAVTDSSGAVTATPLSAGRYRVSFPTSVAGCGLTATAGSDVPQPNASSLVPFMVMVARSTTSPNDVQVQTVRHDGITGPEPFWLTVNC